MDTSISTKSQHTQVTIFHATKLPGEKSKGLLCEWKRLTFDSSCYFPLTFSIKESLNKSKITIFQCDDKRSLQHCINYDDFCFYFWVGIPPPPYIYSPWFHSSNQIIHLFYCNQSSAVVPGNSVQTHTYGGSVGTGESQGKRLCKVFWGWNLFPSVVSADWNTRAPPSHQTSCCFKDSISRFDFVCNF